MRFSRAGFHEFRDTYRKRLAFLRKQLRERESYPLFADQIAAEQIDVDAEMAERRAIWNKENTAQRAARAMAWRKARAKLAAYPHPERRELLAYWQRCSLPGDPEYLLSVIHSHVHGRLDMSPPVVHATEENRKAVAEVIARIAARGAARRGAAL